MITIKSESQIKNIIISSKILAKVKKVIFDAIKPGINGNDLDKLAENEIIKHGAKPAFKGYQGFKNTICISFNEEMIHGIPSDRIIKKGDLLKIDVGCIYNGMYSDSAFTKGVGIISKQDQKLINIAKTAFDIGLNVIKKGTRIGDISHAIGQYVQSQGYFVPENFSGHGIGTALHEEPYIHNTGVAKTGPLLKDGMVICIEPMILQKSNKVKILNDGWTVVSKNKLNTSHYEHTILIKNGLPIVLTKGI